MDVDMWLEDWVESNLVSPGYHDTKESMKADAENCMASAEAEGISRQQLLKAAGGDLESFLLRAQNSLTDAEVSRLAAKDD